MIATARPYSIDCYDTRIGEPGLTIERLYNNDVLVLGRPDSFGANPKEEFE